MGPSETLECPCPPAGAIDIAGKKWAVCVVTLLGRHGRLRFSELQRGLPNVTPGTLVATLRELELHRWISPEVVDSDRRGRRYRLTAEGSQLYQSLLPLARSLRRPDAELRAL